MLSRPDGWHIVTCEYPPQVGGVADCAREMAAGLARAGSPVDVWCPVGGEPQSQMPGVHVHAVLSGFSPAAFRRLGRALDERPSPRRLFVQWVPHGWGCRSMNLPFAAWLWWRSWVKHDDVHLFVHEAFIDFSFRPTLLAVGLVHRLMLVIACLAASHVWVSTETWSDLIRSYLLGRISPRWLPIPAPFEPATIPRQAGGSETRKMSGSRPIVGHFSSYSPLVRPLLADALDRIVAESEADILLIGRDSGEFREEYLRTRPLAEGRVHATGVLASNAIADCVGACAVMLQPYPDGVSARRTSTIGLMRYGIAIVTNAGAGTESFWHAQAGVALVDRPDGSRLGQTVLELLTDTPRRIRLAADAVAMYDRVFDLRHSIAALTSCALPVVTLEDAHA